MKKDHKLLSSGLHVIQPYFITILSYQKCSQRNLSKMNDKSLFIEVNKSSVEFNYMLFTSWRCLKNIGTLISLNGKIYRQNYLIALKNYIR